jgi:hypothetical protein
MVSPLRDEADILIRTAGEAILQSASRLGVVTLAANSHIVEGVKADGTAFSMSKRDSSAMPLALAKLRDEGRQLAVAAVVAKQPVPLAPLTAAAPLVPLSAAQEKLLLRRTLAAAKALTEKEHLVQLVAEAAARGVQQPVSATERVAALRARVLAKGSLPSSSATQ